MIAALVLAAAMTVSAPLIAAGATGTTSGANTCATTKTAKTTLVWNAKHTKRVRIDVYKLVKEKALIDGYNDNVDVDVLEYTTVTSCTSR